MACSLGIVTFLCIIFQIMTTASGLSFALDVAGDGKTIWKIKDTLYLESGDQLRRGVVSKFLPESFKFRNFDLSQGIWAVFPNSDKDCARFGDANSLEWPSSEDNSIDDDHHHGSNVTSSTPSTTTVPPCDISASGSFRCTLRAQLMETVQVRYNFGGNATIRISWGRRQPFQVSANFLEQDRWADIRIDNLSGRTMLVEAIVNNTGDYILIDKITVETLEATTTTTSTTSRPTTSKGKSTTPKSIPTPSPTTPTTSPTNPPTSPSTTETPVPSPSGQLKMMTTLPTSFLLPLTILIISSCFL